MRIDKYLKISRLIKRRTVACSACEAGKIKVNDKVVKPSYNVKVGDIIEMRFAEKITKVRILMISETSLKADAKDMFEYIN